MRVLVLTSMFPHARNRFRGWAVYQRTLALARLCDVRVVSPQPAAALAHDERLDGLEVRRPRWRHLPKAGVLVDGALMARAAARAVARLRPAWEPDLVDAHWLYPDGFAALRVARRLGTPVVVTARGSDANELALRWPVRRPIRRVLREADALVAVSRPLRDTLVELGAPAPRIRVVPNGVDTTLFGPGDRQAAREARGLGPADTVLFSAGPLVASKGFQHLIAGLARLEGVPGARLFIAGAGRHRRALERRARAEGVAERVRFLGHLTAEEMTGWYRAADLFCFASLREGCPNAVLEALACGTPVAAAAVGGVPDLVEPGRDGVLFEPRSAESVAAALAAALGRTWDRAAIAERGGRRSWHHVASEYHQLFTQLLERPEAEL